jgi:hypothetical protein
MKFKGYYSKKTLKPLTNPDILYSRLYLQNKKKSIQLDINELTFSVKNNRIFVYHLYDTKDKNHPGRWYEVSFNPKTQFTYTETSKVKKVRYIIPEYEIEPSKYDGINDYRVFTNVSMDIYFTENGWNKFMKFIDTIIE